MIGGNHMKSGISLAGLARTPERRQITARALDLAKDDGRAEKPSTIEYLGCMTLLARSGIDYLGR